MDKTEQKKPEEKPVISPLANEKTYGERMYSRIFDWGLNYWVNLLASAGFSQWAEHGTKQFKIPLLMKEAATPREIQQKLADGIGKLSILNGLRERSGEAAVARRSMSVARSLTLLTPGFFVMIPSVWLGAKMKPWLVERWNRQHYGQEAMDDPSIEARHQAVRAESRPTFAGTFIARCLTAIAVNITALTIGSNKNWLNKLGEKHNIEGMKEVAIDPITESIGSGLGGALPLKWREAANRFARRNGLSWSKTQTEEGLAKGLYNNAMQDYGRFMVADTVYTLITALLIRPAVKLIRFIPGMSYKPKNVDGHAQFDADGKPIRVPPNRYADVATERERERAAPPTDTLARGEHETPGTHVQQVAERGILGANDAHYRKQA
jgi:hypothetical protein